MLSPVWTAYLSDAMIRSRLNKAYRPASAEVEINLTPMLDVVFILLIFFIITASFVQETGIEVSLLQAKSAVPQEDNPIRISIDRYGEIRIKTQAMDIRTLQGVLRKMHLENPQRAVVILADKASDNASLVKVLDQVHRAGIENIAIAAELDE